MIPYISNRTVMTSRHYPKFVPSLTRTVLNSLDVLNTIIMTTYSHSPSSRTPTTSPSLYVILRKGTLTPGRLPSRLLSFLISNLWPHHYYPLPFHQFLLTLHLLFRLSGWNSPHPYTTGGDRSTPMFSFSCLMDLSTTFSVVSLVLPQ